MGSEPEKLFTDPKELINRFGLTVVSDEEAEAMEKKELADREAERKSQLLTWYRSKASGVPERYYNESLDTFKADSGEAMVALEKTRGLVSSKKCRVLILCGKAGTGKTHLGCGAIRERGGIYINMLRLVYEVDSTMSFKTHETKIQLLDRLCDAPLLVLDEVARMKVREEYQQELACYILMERYAKMKPSIVIGNLNKDGMLKWLGNAVVDRFRECADCVELTGPTYRMNKRKEVFNKNC